MIFQRCRSTTNQHHGRSVLPFLLENISSVGIFPLGETAQICSEIPGIRKSPKGGAFEVEESAGQLGRAEATTTGGGFLGIFWLGFHGDMMA